MHFSPFRDALKIELIFVYNAESGKLSALLDLGHKIVSPESYQCNLCNLTHGNFTERKEWKRLKESTSLDLVFLHKDEFEREYGKRFSSPIVLKRDKGLEVVRHRTRGLSVLKQSN